LFFVLPQAAALAETRAASAATMGSKAYGLLRLVQLGLPVPPAFVLGTALCREYFDRSGRLADCTRDLLTRGLARLEEATGRGFGNTRRPLLVSVRSGAAISMPGMLQTLLNVGLCEHNLRGLLRTSGNPRQVRDCYRRLVRDFAEVVHGADAAQFDALVARHCAEQGLTATSELDAAALGLIAEESLELTLALTGQPFPQDPMQQLLGAVEAVFRSWNDEKARQYRRANGIDDAMGTAVTIQAMVLGNSGGSSGAGVGFTRDPASGENRPYVDFLFNAQGEDVVSGRHAGH
jgi:pyruvate,orthophosphate dikinase